MKRHFHGFDFRVRIFQTELEDEEDEEEEEGPPPVPPPRSKSRDSTKESSVYYDAKADKWSVNSVQLQL
jgi:hypothetical protein